MKPVEKQKMCPSCDGRIPIDSEVCPYCTQEFQTQPLKSQSSLFQSQSLEDSLASLYKPPYQSKRPSHDPLPIEKSSSISSKNVEASLYGNQRQEELLQEPKGSLLSIILLLSAGHLFVFGILLFVFAQNGVLHLEWNANNWFFYCLGAIPLLYFGWKQLQKLT